MKILKGFKNDLKSKEFFQDLIKGKEKEFNDQGQAILKTFYVNKQCYSYLVIESLETATPESMVESLRFRVSTYDDLDLIDETLFDFSNAGYKNAVNHLERIIDELREEKLERDVFVGKADWGYFVDIRCNHEHYGQDCACKNVDIVETKEEALEIGRKIAKEEKISMSTDWD